MRLLYIIAQEDNGRYVSIRLDSESDLIPHSALDPDSATGIIESMTPEQEEEEDNKTTLTKQQALGDIDRVLARNQNELSKEGLQE